MTSGCTTNLHVEGDASDPAAGHDTTSTHKVECRVCYNSICVTSQRRLHVHGPRHNRCMGSGTHAEDQGYKAVDDNNNGHILLPQSGSHNAMAGFNAPPSTTTIPFIPKAARPAAATLYTKLLQECTANPTDLERWNRLFLFAHRILFVPKRGGKTAI